MRLIDADTLLLAVSCVLLAIVSIFQSWQIYKLERRTQMLMKHCSGWLITHKAWDEAIDMLAMCGMVERRNHEID